MKIEELFEQYKNGMTKKKIVFCHFQTMQGFQFTSTEEFANFLSAPHEPIYILNSFSNKDTDLYDYFQMEKVEPHLVLIKHPVNTNAYYKALPDKILDSFVSTESNVYRYLLVDYDNNIKEFVIELPQTLDAPIFKFLKSKISKTFFRKEYVKSSLSLIFTNSNRYKILNEANFIILNYNDIYKDWDIKNITSENLSKKIWKDITKRGI